MEQLGVHWTDFDQISYCVFFSKICPEFPISIKIWPIILATFPEQLCAFMIIRGLIVVSVRNVADKIVQKIKTHILCSITLFPKSCSLWDNVGKCCRAGQDNRWQYGTYAVHGGYLRLQSHNHNILYSLFFHCSSRYANTPHCYYYTNIACLVNCRCSHRTVCRLQQGTSITAAGTPGNVPGDWCETLWCVPWCHRL